MDNLVLLCACLVIGILLSRFKRVPDNAHIALNVFIITVSLPALTLVQIHAVSFDPALIIAVLMPWLLFIVSVLLFSALGRTIGLPRATTGALAVMAGLGNTSFIGLPMIDTFYGATGMPVGIIIDQLGTYLVLSTLGIAVICFYSEGSISLPEVVRRIATFPPLIALVAALVLLPVAYPDWLTSSLTRLGSTLAPLALVSIGLQFRLATLRGNGQLLACGLGYKLLVGPLLLGALYFGAMGLHGATTRITVFEAAMAPQVGGSIVAMQYGLDARLITLMVGIGTVLSFLTLPL